MIPRYTDPRLGEIFSDHSKFSKWLEIEILACEAQAQLGLIPQEAARRIREKASFDIERIEEIEQVTRHDVVAFTTAVADYIGEDSRYFHRGLTSSDLLDTTLALQMREAGMILLQDLDSLARLVGQRAVQYKDTPIIGRTHGVHAEPTSLGLKFALWYDELTRHRRRLESAVEEISYGKLSGAVGTYAYLAPEVEQYVMDHLDLKPAPISNQVIQRDRHAVYLSALALVGCSLEQFATEIRALQKTEVSEVMEGFSKGQKGSSAMPHKKNPITCERIAGMARLLRGNALAAMENVALWHERDISHSSVERVIIPDSCIILHYMLQTFEDIIKNLVVDEERMLRNIGITKGSIFSQGVLIALVDKGLSREQAYRMVQETSFRANRQDREFKDVLMEDKEISKYLAADEIAQIFSLPHHLAYADQILHRLGLLD